MHVPGEGVDSRKYFTLPALNPLLILLLYLLSSSLHISLALFLLFDPTLSIFFSPPESLSRRPAQSVGLSLSLALVRPQPVCLCVFFFF